MITAIVPSSGQYPLVDVGASGLIDDSSLVAIQQVHHNLITMPVCVNDSTIEALIDSGASLVVQMADRSKAFIIATCSVQLLIGVLTAIDIFYVLHSTLDMVLGMHQLYKVNPHIYWDEQTFCMYCNCRWVSLPICSTDKVVQPSINADNNIKIEQDPVGLHTLRLESASQFNKSLKKAEVFVGFVSAIDECNFTHRTAHGDMIDNQLDLKSKALLDEMQSCYPKVFEEPQYPITENCVLFSIQLVDDKLPLPKRNLYPLNEPELQELHE